MTVRFCLGSLRIAARFASSVAILSFMLVDEAQITVSGGHGGSGKVSYFSRRGGPSGGNGGRGGDVYFEADTNIPSLKKYVEQTDFKAGDGAPGGINRRDGANGLDLTLKVPNGTTLIDEDTGDEIELNRSNSKVLVCSGGRGGFGNNALKNAIDQTPRKATPGEAGRNRRLKLILKLIADFGLVGLPNAGKSSLLNALTATQVKTAAYPFTTLEPNLGVINGKVIADIPGLIEGASKGKGLGIKFLKHIEKVDLLLHCISVESDNPQSDYLTVLDEMEKYNSRLMKKNTIILLTKTDLVTPSEIGKKTAVLKKFQDTVLPVSILDDASLVQLKSILR